MNILVVNEAVGGGEQTVVCHALNCVEGVLPNGHQRGETTLLVEVLMDVFVLQLTLLGSSFANFNYVSEAVAPYKIEAHN